MKFTRGRKYDPYSKNRNPDGSDIQRNPQAAIPGIQKITPYKMLRSQDFKLSEIPAIIKNFTDEEKESFFEGDSRKSIPKLR